MGFSVTQSGLPAPAPLHDFIFPTRLKNMFFLFHSGQLYFHMFNLTKLKRNSKSFACLKIVHQISLQNDSFPKMFHNKEK